MDRKSEYRLVVDRYGEDSLYFYYDTRAELVVSEMMIQKGLRGISGVHLQQWTGEDHIRFNGESAYMGIAL